MGLVCTARGVAKTENALRQSACAEISRNIRLESISPYILPYVDHMPDDQALLVMQSLDSKILLTVLFAQSRSFSQHNFP